MTHAKRTDMHLNHERGIPTLHRHEICEIAETAWRMIDHKKVAKTGYLQTGPALPLEGPIRRDAIYKDLRTVLDAIDPPVGTQEMGQQLRDEAVAFVQEGFPNKWSTWEHAKRLIVEQDEMDDPIPEGLEAYGYEIDGAAGGGDDTEDSDDSDSDATDDGADDDDSNPGGGPGGGMAEMATTPPGSDHGGDGHERDAAEGNPPECHPCTVVEAREVLINEARRTNDDVILRRLLRLRDGDAKEEKDGATAVAKALQKRALAKQAEDAAKREEARKEERRARADVHIAEQRKAEALARREEDRLNLFRENMRKRKEDMAQREAVANFRAQQNWLQTEYPRDLAEKLMRWAQSKRKEEKLAFQAKLGELSSQNWFRFMPRVPPSWDEDKTALIRYGSVKPLVGSGLRAVRCSPAFDAFLDEVSPPAIAGGKDPIRALERILAVVAPGSPRFVFQRERTFLRFLHLHNYILDKAFVSCIICLSKWLTARYFPKGVFQWPPHAPSHLLTRPPLAPPGDGDLTPPAVACDDGDLSPRRRSGFPPMGSDGRI